MDVQKMVGERLLVKIDDGRILDGTLVCTDPLKNLVLGGSRQYENVCGAEGQKNANKSTFLGTVSIPGRHIIQIVARKGLAI